MKYLIIYGSSSHTTGKTWGLVSELTDKLSADFVNLSQCDLSYYDYNHANQNDDFKDIAEKMVAADCIIFATPVYWYAMSAPLKVFFDRLSDLLTIRKPLGRGLKNKMVSVFVTGHDIELPEGFIVPFKRTAEYFDMHFQTHAYICTNTEFFNDKHSNNMLNEFIQTVRINELKFDT